MTKTGFVRGVFSFEFGKFEFVSDFDIRFEFKRFYFINFLISSNTSSG